MKKTSSSRLFISVLFLCNVGAPFAGAQADTPQWTALRQESEFKQLTTNDKIAFVCVGCKTISPIATKSQEEAAKLGKEGAIVPCPNCQLVTKVIVRASRKDLYAPPVVTYINEKGEEVAFIVTTADAKPTPKRNRTTETSVNADSASTATRGK